MSSLDSVSNGSRLYQLIYSNKFDVDESVESGMNDGLGWIDAQ